MLLHHRKRPWVIVEQSGNSCFVLNDAEGFAIAHFFFAVDGEAKLGYLRKDEAKAAAEAVKLLSLGDGQLGVTAH